MKKLTSLTQEQIDKLPDYVTKWVNIGLATGKCDFEAAKKAAIKCYEIAGLTPPTEFYVFDCPLSAARGMFMINRNITDPSLVDLNDPEVKSEINTHIGGMIYGSMDGSWLSFYDFFNNECGLDYSKIDGLVEMSKVCGWWAPHTTSAVFQHRPKAIHRDNEHRLHNTEGPAVEFYGEGLSNVYAVHGIRVSKKIIDRNYTYQDVDSEENAEIRRIMIDLYPGGMAKYVLDSNAEIVHKDDFGTVYRKPQKDDEDIYMVEVVNCTPEPDGSFKNYLLSIDPRAYGDILTGRSAVASTWRYEKDDGIHKRGELVFKTPEEYQPIVET